MKILLVEDMAGFARPIRDELTSHGYEVTWIIGAARIEQDRIVGIVASPSLEGMNPDTWNGEQDRLVEIAAADVDLALLDGDVFGPVRKGEAFAQFLTARGVRCISITGGGAGAEVMAQAGCIASVPKQFVLLSLRKAALVPERVVSVASHKSPVVVARSLKRFSDRMRRDYCAASTAHRRFSTGFPMLDRAA